MCSAMRLPDRFGNVNRLFSSAYSPMYLAIYLFQFHISSQFKRVWELVIATAFSFFSCLLAIRVFLLQNQCMFHFIYSCPSGGVSQPPTPGPPPSPLPQHLSGLCIVASCTHLLVRGALPQAYRCLSCQKPDTTPFGLVPAQR